MTDRVQTHNDGVAYKLDPQQQLRRFLILGSEGDTYYASQRELLTTNVEAVRQALDTDFYKAIDEIVDVSDRALAPSNEPALLALAIASSHQNVACRQYALSKLKEVCRTSTHLFHFMAYLSKMRSHGSAVQKAIADWYLSKSPMSLAVQVTKYQQRDGWSHKDMINIAHVKGQTPFQQEMLRWLTYGDNEITTDDRVAEYFGAIERAKTADVDTLVDLVKEFKLSREVLPTSAMTEKRVWEAMLPTMGYTALIRNLGNMSRLGVITDFSDNQKTIVSRITDSENIKNARIHPIDIIKAYYTYRAGHGIQNSWIPNQGVVDALQAAFYDSFGYVQPTGKKGIIALDVSSSMCSPNLQGIQGFTPRTASAVMAMVSIRTETEVVLKAFSGELVPIDISKHDSIEAVTQKMANIRFGTTNCSLPIRYALDNNLNIDYFSIYTDSETMGNPQLSMETYRKRINPDARLVIVAMVSNRLTLSNAPYALNVSGFDSSTPALISEFVSGNI